MSNRLVPILGPLLLGAVIALLCIHISRWRADADCLGRRDLLRAIDERFLETELETLQKEEKLGEIPADLLDVYWDQHQKMVAGTKREAAARAAREASRSLREDRRSRLASEIQAGVDSLLQGGHLEEAAARALSIPVSLRGTGRGRRLQEDLRESFRKKGWIILEGGERRLGRGADGRVLRLKDLLVEREPVPSPAGSGEGPLTGISLDEALSMASRDGGRLLTFSEREAVAEDLPGAESPEGLLEWVLPDRRDPLESRGYGCCYRDAPAGPSPAAIAERRKSDRGYPDVAFRRAIEICRPPAGSS